MHNLHFFHKTHEKKSKNNHRELVLWAWIIEKKTYFNLFEIEEREKSSLNFLLQAWLIYIYSSYKYAIFSPIRNRDHNLVALSSSSTILKRTFRRFNRANWVISSLLLKLFLEWILFPHWRCFSACCKGKDYERWWDGQVLSIFNFFSSKSVVRWYFPI